MVTRTFWCWRSPEVACALFAITICFTSLTRKRVGMQLFKAFLLSLACVITLQGAASASVPMDGELPWWDQIEELVYAYGELTGDTYTVHNTVAYNLSQEIGIPYADSTYLTLMAQDHALAGGNGNGMPLIVVTFSVDLKLAIAPQLSNAVASADIPWNSVRLVACNDELYVESRYQVEGDWWKAPSGLHFHTLRLHQGRWLTQSLGYDHHPCPSYDEPERELEQRG